jgi:membrane protease subunit HflK
MRGDYLNYRDATRVSLGGLALHLAWGLFVLLYAIYGRDHAAQSIAFYVLTGTAAWLTLAIVFDQHRRERVEALEAASLAAAGGSAASVFNEGAQDLRLAARRLAGMHRWLVPIVGVALGAGLILLGIIRRERAFALADAANYVRPAHTGWAIVIGLALAVTGFLFARFVSGMAKQSVWRNLGAGATWSVASALMGLALAVAHFSVVAGTDVVYRWLAPVAVVAQVVLGAEIILNFLLELYRPRKQGDVPRPAFESRLLSFVAAPDRIAQSIGEAISYQLGRDVRNSWMYRLLTRYWAALIAVGLLGAWLLSAVAVVLPHQRAMVLRLGAVREANLAPGWHFKLPWPVERVVIPTYTYTDQRQKTHTLRTTEGVRTLHVGSPAADRTTPGPLLWTEQHVTEERYLIVRAGGHRGAGGGDEGLALVAVEVPVGYVITDVLAWETFASPRDREALLRAVAERAVMQHLASMTLHDMLGTRRAALGEALRERIDSAFRDLPPSGAGVRILSVGTQGIHPPVKVAPSFESVIATEHKTQAWVLAARADAARRLTEVAGSVDLAREIIDALTAEQELEARGAPEEELEEHRLAVQRLIERAQGRAATMILEARADRWARHMGERARLARYMGQVSSYRAAPMLFQATLYLDALREAMSGSRLFITDGVRLRLRFEAQERDTGFSVFNPEGSGGSGSP